MRDNLVGGSGQTAATILGKLETLTRAPSGDYVAVIERHDVDTCVQHRHIELTVAPAAVDAIIALKGALEPLTFTVKDGKIIQVSRAMRT